jgi:hypothetical protein
MKALRRHSVRAFLAAGVLALVLAPGAAPKGTTVMDSPGLTFACTPAPTDCTGWYTTNVTIRWSWDATVIQTDCPNAVDTVSTDTQGKLESCAVKNGADQWTRKDVTLKLDKTPPSVTAAVPDRAPDVNGWYNHPLSVTYQGSDPTSGVAGCTVTGYTGPDSPSASVLGTCRDNAGNTSAPQPYGFKYDASAPIVKASSAPLNHLVVLRWAVSPNTQMVAIHRAPLSPRKTQQKLGARVYQGAGTRFRDTHVENGISYVYTLQAVSEAGLSSFAKIAATPTPLFSPRRGAVLDRPPTLRWAPVPRATYYNVQLRRNGKKILSIWPERTSLQLRWRWRFEHRRFRFSSGRYQWYVWPGFGAPATARYGRLLGQSGFIVRS